MGARVPVRTVLGFDSWVGGAHNYERLVLALRERGFNLILLHIGSWGGDRGRPAREFHGDLEMRDISFYKSHDFAEVLRVESPAAVVFLSNDVFAHRAFNRYSLQAGIPTLRLYHGLVRVQAVDEGKPHKVNVLNQARFAIMRLPKALIKVWPCYIKALLRTGGRKSEWTRFVSDIFNLACGRYIVKGAADSRTTKAAVYAASDVTHAIDKYGHSRSEVHVVGNPDIARFGVQAAQIGSAATPGRACGNEIVYVDTGLIYAGMVFGGPDDYLDHLTATRASLERQGRSMAIKLHPQHFRCDFAERVERAGIEVLTNDNFAQRLQTCAAAIVEPSTAALMPSLIGTALLLARFGKLSGQLYGDVLASYPRARYLDAADELNEMLLREKASYDECAVRQWIEENAGPLPAEHMPARVAALIDDMAQQGAVRKCAE